MSAARPDVLVAHPLLPAQMADLGHRYRLHRLDEASDEGRAAVLAAAGPVCAAMVADGRVTVDAALLDRLPALRMIACASAGFDRMDVAALGRRGIRLTNTSPALCDDVADMALLLMLAARRRLVAADAYLRRGDWARQGPFPLTASSAGKRAGILGFGQIGAAIARRLAPLGLAIGYGARHPKPGVAYPHFADPVALARWADVLIVAVPGGVETAGLVSAEVISALGPEGCLVNIARGSVVDEPALIRALAEGRLASAGLDVFRDEPDPDPALLALPNVVLSPHHASGTRETRAAMSQLALDNLDAFFAGKPLLTPVN